jgi:hypothetical protein
VKLEGSLDIFPLRELIDMAVYSSVTGVINVYSHGVQGHLYFRDGTLYHAVRGRTQGIDALAELLEFSSGTFTVVNDVISDEESIWGALTHHLQTAERLASRWRMVRPYVPTLDVTPILLVPREAALRRIGPAHQHILAAIDGQATLREIAAAIGWAEIDAAEAIVQMSVDGLVDLRTRREGGADAPAPEAQAGHGGVFDRLRARGQQQTPRAPEAVLVNDARTPEDLILKLLRG